MAEQKIASEVIITPEVRCMFAPALFKPSRPRDKPQAAEKYAIVIAWPKQEQQTTMAIWEAIQRAAAKAPHIFGLPAGIPYQHILPNQLNYIPLKDADTFVGDDGKIMAVKYPEMRGHYFMRASSDNKPGIVDINGGMPIPDETGFYSGCYCRVQLAIRAFQNGLGKGISAYVNNVLKTRDGMAIAARQNAQDAFKDLLQQGSGIPGSFGAPGPAWGGPAPAPAQAGPAWGGPAPAPAQAGPAWGGPAPAPAQAGPAWGGPAPAPAPAPAWGGPAAAPAPAPAWGGPAAAPAPAPAWGGPAAAPAPAPAWGGPAAAPAPAPTGNNPYPF